jgi:hypothetical protein
MNKTLNVVPFNFTSQQTSDANIFIVGGCLSPMGDRGLKQCLCVDANMQVYDREGMNLGRFNTPLALVRDRFLILCGGQINQDNSTNLCEAFDTETNTWFGIAPLSKPMSNTSAVVMNNRFIYLLPGTDVSSEHQALKTDSCSIEVLDTGSSI